MERDEEKRKVATRGEKRGGDPRKIGEGDSNKSGADLKRRS